MRVFASPKQRSAIRAVPSRRRWLAPSGERGSTLRRAEVRHILHGPRFPPRITGGSDIRLRRQTAVPQPRSAAVPDLPQALVARLEQAVSSDDTTLRQQAIDDLVHWARRNPAIVRVDWVRVASVLYVASRSGSQTFAEDPGRIRVEFGRDPFLSVSDLYSTFRHEMTHVVEHQDPDRGPFVRSLESSALQEIRAYLWELDNAETTGLSRRENWGLDSRDQGWNRGLARVVDGLFRNVMRDPSWQDRVSATERENINRWFGCSLLSTPREVIDAVMGPEAPTEQQLARACLGGNGSARRTHPRGRGRASPAPR